ncbi:barstar family protein [Streptomyces abyssomicinicus]|uniref:barstar family protein n=1 Tax=Streptomyces abyssomicinicus TaxID=574929 RepID=UPI001FEAF945|nr:barstar family protein [Streptomyces abyssomicinicus]
MQNDITVAVGHALPPTGLIYSARMRGQEMADSDGVFTQFYEALRLPDYFGWNWDALRDCLSDLHWISAQHFLLTVDDTDAVLSANPDERRFFFKTLQRSAEFWAAQPELPGQNRTTFRVVMLCPPELTQQTQRELTAG